MLCFHKLIALWLISLSLNGSFLIFPWCLSFLTKFSMGVCRSLPDEQFCLTRLCLSQALSRNKLLFHLIKLSTAPVISQNQPAPIQLCPSSKLGDSPLVHSSFFIRLTSQRMARRWRSDRVTVRKVGSSAVCRDTTLFSFLASLLACTMGGPYSETRCYDVRIRQEVLTTRGYPRLSGILLDTHSRLSGPFLSLPRLTSRGPGANRGAGPEPRGRSLRLLWVICHVQGTAFPE
jgi:hypothetical protein